MEGFFLQKNKFRCNYYQGIRKYAIKSIYSSNWIRAVNKKGC